MCSGRLKVSPRKFACLVNENPLLHTCLLSGGAGTGDGGGRGQRKLTPGNHDHHDENYNHNLKHYPQVQERVTKQAINVMDLYAKRARIERDPCRPDGPDMEEFCKGFEHNPTVDQVANSLAIFLSRAFFHPPPREFFRDEFFLPCDLGLDL